MAFGTDAFGETAFGEDGATDTVTGAVGTLTRPGRPPGKIAPNGYGFPPIVRPTIPGTTITVVGIGPNENVGIPSGSAVTPILAAAPAGIASTNAFGTPTLASGSPAQIFLTGIAATEKVGIPYGHTAISDVLPTSPLVARRAPGRVAPGGFGPMTAAPIVVGSAQTINPNGIPVTGAYTNQAGAGYTNQAGVQYTVEQFPPIGSPTVANFTAIHPSGIASTNGFGSPNVKGPSLISPAGIPKTNTFGTPTVAGASATIHPAGIPSTNAFGKIGHLSIFPTGIATTNRFGTPIVKRAAQWNVQEPYGHWQVGFPRGRWVVQDAQPGS